MKKHFSDVVEDVKQLDPEDKLELRSLLDKYLREERRREIRRHYEAAKEEEPDLSFTNDINELRKSLSE